MPWPLYLALKQLFPTGRFFSFYSGLSIVGVTLGVMVLLIVQTVMNGFGDKIRENIVARDADIRVIGNGILYDWKPLLAELEKRPEVLAATPYAEGVVMMKNDNIPFMPFIRGIDLNRESNVFPLDQFLGNVEIEELSCTLDDLDDETIILGIDLAHSLQSGPGTTLEIFTPLMLEKAKRDEVLLPREMELAGLFQSGWYEVDSNSAIVTLRVMQELYGLGSGVHGIALKLNADQNAEIVARTLQRYFDKSGTHDVRVLSWLKKNESFLFFLKMEKWVMFFIMIFIILVASFSIAVTLSVSVLRKNSRDRTPYCHRSSSKPSRVNFLPAKYRHRGYGCCLRNMWRSLGTSLPQHCCRVSAQAIQCSELFLPALWFRRYPCFLFSARLCAGRHIYPNSYGSSWSASSDPCCPS